MFVLEYNPDENAKTNKLQQQNEEHMKQSPIHWAM